MMDGIDAGKEHPYLTLSLLDSVLSPQNQYIFFCFHFLNFISSLVSLVRERAFLPPVNVTLPSK